MRTLLTILFTFCSILVFAEAQEHGLASVYSATFQGKRTASGELFNHNNYTAAHQKYPFGSYVKVTRVDNGKFVIVRINDRGPFVSRRVTDLSKAAAQKLGVMHEKEEIEVKLELMNHNAMSEISQSNNKDSNNNLPASSHSSQKHEGAVKNNEEKAVLKEYKYTRTQPNRNANSQKKNL
ncbi:MAG: septal ring lytic transglycosylase RlpA family protein [Saprospiraceae bacterium]|nr:septal ring lytic transglycosylase RlpA family protein [Saprospiraceae bacterium]